MNKHYLIFLFFLSSSFSYGQQVKNGMTINTASENNRWNINEYLWSQSNNKTEKWNNKPALNFESLDDWKTLNDYILISNDGKYFAYGILKGSGFFRQFDSLVIQATNTSWRLAFSNSKTGYLGDYIKPGFFSGDSRQYIFQEGKDLCILRNGSGDRRNVHNVTSYKVCPDGNNKWLAYLLKDNTMVIENLVTGIEKRIANAQSYEFNKSGLWLAVKLKNGSKGIVLYDPNNSKELRFENVDDFFMNDEGESVLLKIVEKSNNETIQSLQYVNLPNGSKKTIWSTSASTMKVGKICLDISGTKAAFVINNDLAIRTVGPYLNGSEIPVGNSIWMWQEGESSALLKIKNGSIGIDNNMLINDAVSFTDNSEYLQFELQFKPDSLQPSKNAISMDVWNYKDKSLQSNQAKGLNETENYKCIYNIKKGITLQLENEDYSLRRWSCSNSNYAVIAKPIEKICCDRFWENDYLNDSTWVLSFKDGQRKLLPIARGADRVWLSPNGKYLLMYCTMQLGNYFSYDLNSGALVNISKGVPAWQFGFDRNLFVFEKPPKVPAGLALWQEDRSIVLVYDNYDVWELDLTGKKSPINVTNGYGSKTKTVLSLLNGSQGEPNHKEEILSFIGKDSLLLRAFNSKNKFNGFYLKKLNKPGDPEKLFMGPCFFSRPDFSVDGLTRGMIPVKAKLDNIWILNRQTSNEAPNYFVTRDFKDYKPLTNIQPNSNYNWITTEYHSFKLVDGTISRGVLYKPENFDSSKKYPVIISFYGHCSDRVYQYPLPRYIYEPSIFDYPSWMVCHGYLVFTPDVLFNGAAWGPCILNSIDGAAKYLSELSYVDNKSIGAVGHSNSGRFGYYLLTHSKSFAAISIGSGGGGIDILRSAFKDDDDLAWAEYGAFGGGLGKLWDNKSIWIDHTGILQVDKVTSPVLSFYNKQDRDGESIPIEMFISLHRLEKKAWWLQYDAGAHELGQLQDQKDFTIRYTQFFDHYLKNAPAPRWMTQGIPYKLKGIEARYELDAAGSCALMREAPKGKDKDSLAKYKNSHCYICEAWNKQYKRTPAMFEKEIKYWELDKDLKEELDKKQKAERARLDKEQVVEDKKIVNILKYGYVEDEKRKKMKN